MSRARRVQDLSSSGEAFPADLFGLVVEPPRDRVLHLGAVRRRLIDYEAKLDCGLGNWVVVGGFRSHVISMNKGCDTMIPMALQETLQADLTAAMKAGDDVRKTTLRAILTAVKTALAAEGAPEQLSDEAIQKLITTEVKQRNEAAEIFAEAGEAARAANELAEREVLQAYLPEPLSDDDLERMVSQVIAAGGYESRKDMGSAIKDVMAEARGRADGKTVSAAVGKVLGS